MKHTLTVLVALTCVSAAEAQYFRRPGYGNVPGRQVRPGAYGGAYATSRGSPFIGSSVTLNNRSFGRIVDYAMAPSGQIRYAIVDSGGRYVALPAGALQYDNRTSGYAINSPNVSTNQLRGSLLQRDYLPNHSNRSYQPQQWTQWGGDAFRPNQPIMIPRASMNLRDGGGVSPALPAYSGRTVSSIGGGIAPNVVAPTYSSIGGGVAPSRTHTAPPSAGLLRR